VPELSTRPIVAPDQGADALRGAVVSGVATALPPTVVGNEGIAARLGVTENWIVGRTGVHERRYAAPGETVADYASEAARASLAAAGIEPLLVDLVLVATMSHEQLTPSASAQVADRIGATAAGALDVNAACSGFVSALSLAAGQIESGRVRTAVVVGADLISRITDPDDRSTAALFGDGAGAVVVSAGARGGVGPAVLGSDGARADLITASRQEGIIRMRGHDTFRHAVDRLSEATVDAAAAAGRPLDEIDLFAFHQANGRILTAVGERLGLDRSRVIDCIGRYGNTSAATIPMALAEARDAGRLTPGTTVLLAAFGGGLTWAATVIEWGGEEASARG
jgi:3-oxoacyl-[acyl-carrier-protein] synthase III